MKFYVNLADSSVLFNVVESASDLRSSNLLVFVSTTDNFNFDLVLAENVHGENGEEPVKDNNNNKKKQ